MPSKNEILKQKLIDKILDIFHTVEPEDTNVKRMKSFLENMTVQEFDKYIQYLKSGDTQIFMYAPNVKTTIKQTNILKAAKKLGVLIQERIWMTDIVTGKRYLTPNKYVILKLPIRRVSQFLLHKMSMPESDKTIDVLTGQVTGDDRASSITQVEIQALFARDLKNTLIELVKVRGGDISAYADFKQQLSETGEISLQALDTSSTARSVVITSVFLKSMMLDNNLYEGS